MAGEKKIDKGEPVSTVVKADPVTGLSDQEVVSGKDGIPSDSKSMSALLDATSSIKGETDQVSVGEHGVYYPPTSCYNYYYPGYTGSFTQMDDHAYMHANSSHTGAQSDSGSMLYYLPSYNPYAPGTLMGMDGQGVGQQQYYPSSGYVQPPISYGSEAAPSYSWDSTFGGDVSTAANAGSGNVKAGPGSTALSRSNGFTSTKASGPLASKFSKPLPLTQPGKSLNKVPHLGNDFSAGLLKGYPPAGRFSSFTNQKYGLFPPTGQTYYQSNGRILNGNDRFKSREKYNRNEDFESSAELTRGPRSRNKSSPLDSPIEKEELGITVRRDKYNLPDFQTDHEKAKFYVIKSYSEDDVHKSIKYDVWASTPNGNKKLDAAFHDAELKLRETNTQCPIFLFFSVNGSGQFVGVAEMIGRVDFNKDMDFWQVDKWSGFFPVKWHVIKDIPNPQLRHIILENNDNRPVTFTRDTQEIGHKQGLEMLNIFKSYTAKTSLLDDFTFYENREKSLQAKRSNKPATLKMENYDNGDITKHMNAGGRNIDVESGGMRMGSLISLTKNMSLNACQ
ncbi:YTH domain-containing protein ECT3 isoform X1 [Pyrus x bretschneideri]|uniref:YTH domain-containing protein ECT3 isoform X1 n=2 Tax=Pyrus x bretschneideri TaxID=225117 RepID=UPI0020306405|nr:YTH domain-containing protein ECT3 isoform X1 [Pyrus x bretschneideri]XP_048437646.1 YTH domain-containing protein ECT3 isoform X1 [Pyrus x bretschneideri]